jgi:hypothetical protein
VTFTDGWDEGNLSHWILRQFACKGCPTGWKC